MENTTQEKPLQPGEKVFVRNQTMGGKTIIEGDAVIVRPASADPSLNLFKVRFGGERMTFTRTVLPEHRHDDPALRPVSKGAK